MSDFKGTKGKWIFNDEDFKVRGTGDIEGMTVISNLSPQMDYSRGKNTQWANGTLIAAAPDLLEALLKLQDVINRAAAQNCVHAIETDEVNMINAAIAKAVQP